MKRITGSDLAMHRAFFDVAADIAKHATCHRDFCGAVIVKDGQIIGQGYNGSAVDGKADCMCNSPIDLTVKPKFDKTGCIHAEWRAIIDACKRNGDKIDGSTLYFMRLNSDGEFTNAGDPYCTVCSRLTVESGVGEFALWNTDGADIYDAAEYNKKSYDYFTAL